MTVTVMFNNECRDHDANKKSKSQPLVHYKVITCFSVTRKLLGSNRFCGRVIPSYSLRATKIKQKLSTHKHHQSQQSNNLVSFIEHQTNTFLKQTPTMQTVNAKVKKGGKWY
ncbi:hypothetical protein JHK85_000739 [Glycine max]|uniref:Uncharacterized protein n=2 Tax=Glycine subgen. Soja TaxID=1462606 RepID=A0A0R0LCP2_SOYBN|nr:hypothetical protein JHK87_000728 [Glycine soja]KAG5068362.1 hypothetical protein JHK85_000739 [Glycine max]KAG5088108.1 hypothetical protein JHK86_000720 [Glycine max]KAH1161965.1 hypothetical protein GYH30_000722 [Glycine max]RZC28826.1 hypothetical protein D0Y65_000700 [Glycine soja]